MYSGCFCFIFLFFRRFEYSNLEDLEGFFSVSRRWIVAVTIIGGMCRFGFCCSVVSVDEWSRCWSGCCLWCVKRAEVWNTINIYRVLIGFWWMMNGVDFHARLYFVGFGEFDRSEICAIMTRLIRYANIICEIFTEYSFYTIRESESIFFPLWYKKVLLCHNGEIMNNYSY